MIYLSAHESNHLVPSPFRKLDRKAHELYLNDRNQVSQRSKADIRLLWLIHMQFQETELIPAGHFLLHLPQCLMQSKSLPDAGKGNGPVVSRSLATMWIDLAQAPS